MVTQSTRLVVTQYNMFYNGCVIDMPSTNDQSLRQMQRSSLERSWHLDLMRSVQQKAERIEACNDSRIRLKHAPDEAIRAVRHIMSC